MKSAAPERRESCVYFFGRSSSVLSALPTAPSRGAITFTALSPPDGVFLTRRSDTERQFKDEKLKSVLNLPLVCLNGAWPRAECAAVDSALTFMAKGSTYFLEPLR